MSQNPLRDFLEACTSRVDPDDTVGPAGDDPVIDAAGGASSTGDEFARG